MSRTVLMPFSNFLRNAVCFGLRGTERSNAFLISLTTITTLVGLLRGEYATFIGERYASGLFWVALIAGTASALLWVLKIVKVWRWLPAEYYGLAELIKRHGPRADFRGIVEINENGSARINAEAAIRFISDTTSQTRFAGTDEYLLQQSGEINAQAFRGTIHGLSAKNKVQRNTRLSKRNPLCFALLEQEKKIRGITATVPLTPTASDQYFRGGISDNEVSETQIAGISEPVGAVLNFLIAVNPDIPRVRHVTVMPELLRMSLLQVILIALSVPDQKDFRIAAVNTSKKIKNLFDRLGFKPDRRSSTADQQEVFVVYARFSRKNAARAYLNKHFPQIAEMLT